MAEKKETQILKEDLKLIRFEEVDELSHILVLDRIPEKVRYLYFEDSIQGELNIEKPHVPVLEYIAIMLKAVEQWVDSPKAFCMGGLGTASLFHASSNLFGPDLSWSIVEADSKVEKLAKKWFQFPEDQQVHLSDFRAFCEKDHQLYDAIYVDCYSSYSMPPHMMTAEFMEVLLDRLTDKGAAVFNLWGAEGNSVWKEQLKTIYSVFPSSAFVQCPTDRNLIMIGSKKTLKPPRSPLFWNGNSFPVRMLRPGKGHYFAKQILGDAEVITDGNLGDLLSRHALLI